MSTYIKSIHIGHFGAISNYSYEFDKGVNIIEGNNECGKSTTAAFIKFMFYGLSGRASQISGGVPEKTRWTSREYGMSSGALVLSKNGKNYRIERTLAVGKRAGGKETLSVIDVESGKECFQGEIPGVVFFGISEEIFLQTVYSGQSLCTGVDGKSVKVAIENMLLSGNESISIKNALKKLDEARIKLLHKNKKGGIIYNLSQKESELSALLVSAKSDSARLSEMKARYAVLSKELEKDKKRERELDIYIKRLNAKEKLGLLEQSKRAKADAENAKKALLEKQNEYSYNGFIPDNNYITTLKAARFQCEDLKNRITESENKLEKLKNAQRILPVNTSLAAWEMTEPKADAKKRFEKKKQSVKTSGLTFGIVMAITVLWAVCTLLLGVVLKYSVVIPAIITGVFAILSVGTFIAFRKAQKEYSEMLEKYGIDDIELLAERLDQIERESITRRKLAVEISNTESIIEREKSLYETKISDINSHLALWNRHVQSEGELPALCDEIKGIVDEILSLQTELKSYENACSLVSSSFNNEDESEYQRILDITESEAVEIDIKPCGANAEILELKERIRSSERELTVLANEIASLGARVADPSELISELEKLRIKIKKLSRAYEAYVIAYDSISAASERLRDNIAPRVSEYTELFSKNVTGREREMFVDAEMELNCRDDNAMSAYPDSFLSGGTRDLAYVGLRMALAKLLCGDEIPPLVFDETFCQIDDERLEKVFEIFLKQSEASQIIILTSSSREKRVYSALKK